MNTTQSPSRENPGQSWYANKLRDGRWQKKAAEIKARAGWKCEECEGTHDLTVHHCYYIRGRDPWDYDNGLLICLCWECHQERQMFEDALMLGIALHLRQRATADIKNTPAWVFFSDKPELLPIE